MKFQLALTLLVSTGFWCVAGCSSSSSSSADGDGQGGSGGSNNPSGGSGGNTDDGGVDASMADANIVDTNTGGTAGGGTNGQLDTTAWGPCQMVPIPAGLNANMSARRTPAVAPKCLPVGSTVSRALSLMATSTAAKRHKVKVLFYGQSITKGGWVPATETYLQTTFPYADFEFREEAVGGFWGPLLARTADHDVLPWYPDLMVYHSYGPVQSILDLVRRRTTAEIMLQTHHSAVEKAADAVSGDRQSFIELPELASRLGIHIVDIRGAWKAHLASSGQTAQSLTLPQPDGLHLNEEGNALYAKITNDQLKYDANVIVDPLRMVTKYEVGKDVTWNGNKLTLKFDGNRVDVQAKAGIMHPANAASILIDGKKPSDFVSAYAITRPNREVDADWPWKKGSVIRVTMDLILIPQIEEWTMKLTSINKAGNCTFTVTGSVTGADGMGTCNSQFTSTSKRIRIAADDYWFGPPQGLDPPATISVGSEVKWNVYALHADSYPLGKIDASDATKEYPTTIVQGISNGQHTLELTMTGAAAPAIEAIHVHRPPLR